MSGDRKAWNWRQAFCQSELPATTKHVLQTLSMFMNTMGESCYPSIEDLVEYSGLSKRAVLNHIETARAAGWIKVSQHGFRGQRWKRHEYVARWPERDLIAPSLSERMVKTAEFEEEGGAPDAPAHSKKVVQEVHEGGAPDAPKAVHDVHQDKNSPFNNPIPVQKREGACESKNVKNDNTGKSARKPWLRRLRKAHASWPTYADDSVDMVEKAWFELSEEERTEAQRLASAYVDHCRNDLKRKAVCAFSTYLKEKKWQRLPANSVGGTVAQPAKPYGKLWGVERFVDLLKPHYGNFPKPSAFLAGLLKGDGEAAEREKRQRRAQYGWPRVNAMQHRAQTSSKGVTVANELASLADEFTQVKVGSNLWKAWQLLHEERGWPWLGVDRDLPEWVYMPRLVGADRGLTDDSEPEVLLGLVKRALENFEAVHGQTTNTTTTTQEAAE
ncbi:helix-turn-helix domain-containing protein [Pseudovibrio ascidiaceicola]|uniref:helix-turn-helix domain-containing protein n=1 Tax=Pseudovibrio ascidiaceicola TaxID=285279 RepID=UPI003D3635FA